MMNSITKNLFSLFIILCTVATSTFAQASKVNSDLNIQIAGNKKSFKVNEQVIMRVSGFDEEKNYVQWQVSVDEKTWQDIPRATGDLYETYPVATNQYFRVVTRPLEGYLAVETASKIKAVALEENVAMKSKKAR